MDNKELYAVVESLVAEVDKTHRYSMSRIYDAHNHVFGKSEKPQSCASCLIRKMQELKQWLGTQPNPASTVSSPTSATRKRATTKDAPKQV